tara:strand:- start:531 stop:1094 length:564 start_codon:yes stop_codon:yes gene_type:complete
MANKDSAFGLLPIGKVGQNRDAQGLSEYKIAASATAIYQNDPVKALAAGTIGVAAAGDLLLGSLNGVFYTDSSTQKPTWANHLAAANAATDIVGYVSDDPYERFEIQSAGSVTQADVFQCGDIAYTAGASPNFVSKTEISGTLVSGASAQLRILGISKDINNNDTASANVNVVVNINEHFLNSANGL